MYVRCQLGGYCDKPRAQEGLGYVCYIVVSVSTVATLSYRISSRTVTVGVDCPPLAPAEPTLASDKRLECTLSSAMLCSLLKLSFCSTLPICVRTSFSCSSLPSCLCAPPSLPDRLLLRLASTVLKPAAIDSRTIRHFHPTSGTPSSKCWMAAIGSSRTPTAPLRVLNATLPGSVWTELLADPLLGYTERDYQWIASEPYWRYSKVWEVNQSLWYDFVSFNFEVVLDRVDLHRRCVDQRTARRTHKQRA